MLLTIAWEFGSRGMYLGSFVFHGPKGEKPFVGRCLFSASKTPAEAGPLVTVIAVVRARMSAPNLPSELRLSMAAAFLAHRGRRRRRPGTNTELRPLE
jgi:hypothetical protein